MTETIRSSERPVLTRARRSHISNNWILQQNFGQWWCVFFKMERWPRVLTVKLQHDFCIHYRKTKRWETTEQFCAVFTGNKLFCSYYIIYCARSIMVLQIWKYRSKTMYIITFNRLYIRWKAFTSHENVWKIWGSHSGSYVIIFRDIAPCISYVNRSFLRTYHLHLQCWKSAKASNMAPSQLLDTDSFIVWFLTSRWRWHIPLKSRYTYRLHGAIS
jgi:hypothetical protein